MRLFIWCISLYWISAPFHNDDTMERMAQNAQMQTRRFTPLPSLQLWTVSIVLTFFGVSWLWGALRQQQALPPAPDPALRAALTPGAVARMDSPVFQYTPGWTVSTAGADPHEPADPWADPSGVVTFDYTGAELALQIAVGRYWGYFYVTVDGEPANLLAVVPGNLDSRGERAGYKTFYAPEQTGNGEPVTRWVRVHRARTSASDAVGDEPHHVRIEAWRSWGQIPLRAVAVDGLPEPPRPTWPGVALLVLAFWAGVGACWGGRPGAVRAMADWIRPARKPMAPLVALGRTIFERHSFYWGGAAFVLGAVGVALDLWFVCLPGLALLALVSVYRPVLWLAALLCGLPFYFSVTLPLLPNRAFSLIDIGVLGGVAVLAGRIVLDLRSKDDGDAVDDYQLSIINYQLTITMLLAAIVSWALIATFAAEQFGVALREWRTVFLSAGLFALALVGVLRAAPNPADRWLLIGAWLAGGAVVALIGLWQYASDAMIITAEGVRRVRGLYGSPNNLALYLERTLALSLALALLLPNGRWRWLAAGGAAVQLLALLLTFSKGALLLGLPAMFAAIALAGWLMRPHAVRQNRDVLRPLLLWLCGIGLGAVLLLTPFLGTERFRQLFDVSQGTGFLRLQLWRSAWAMALDHPLLGVGPDNFLYAFRSGYILPAAWQEPNLNHPHNWPLDWWTRLGVPGLILALAFFGLAAARMVQNLRNGRQMALNAGLLAATAAALAHGLIDVSYALPDLMFAWVFLVVMAARAPDR